MIVMALWIISSKNVKTRASKSSRTSILTNRRVLELLGNSRIP